MQATRVSCWGGNRAILHGPASGQLSWREGLGEAARAGCLGRSSRFVAAAWGGGRRKRWAGLTARTPRGDSNPNADRDRSTRRSGGRRRTGGTWESAAARRDRRRTKARADSQLRRGTYCGWRATQRRGCHAARRQTGACDGAAADGSRWGTVGGAASVGPPRRNGCADLAARRLDRAAVRDGQRGWRRGMDGLLRRTCMSTSGMGGASDRSGGVRGVAWGANGAWDGITWRSGLGRGGSRRRRGRRRWRGR
jgi:hypothetical protein